MRKTPKGSPTALATRPHYAISRATRTVRYLTPEEAHQLADAAAQGRKGNRDRLLILLLFQTDYVAMMWR